MLMVINKPVIITAKLQLFIDIFCDFKYQAYKRVSQIKLIEYTIWNFFLNYCECIWQNLDIVVEV